MCFPKVNVLGLESIIELRMASPSERQWVLRKDCRIVSKVPSLAGTVGQRRLVGVGSNAELHQLLHDDTNQSEEAVLEAVVVVWLDTDG